MESLTTDPGGDLSDSIIRRLLESGAALLGGRNRKEVFQRIVEGIVRLGFRRVRLYLISTDRQKLRCAAQVGMQKDFEGEEWDAAGDTTTQILYEEPRPHIFSTNTEHADRHALRLGRDSGDQWVEAPLVLDGKVVGKVCADNEHGPLPVSLDLDLLNLFAQLAAAALEKSRLLDEARHRLSMFERLREVAKTLAGDFDPPALLDSIVKNAAELLGAKNGGIYEYIESLGVLRVVADLNRKDLLGRTMPIGSGMAGRLVQGNQAYMIEHDYGSWPDHDPTCTFFGAVLEVPMRLRGKIAGVIYVDDLVGRRFTEQDAELLAMFTGHAAAALESAEAARDRDARLIRLQRLAEAMAEITANPERPFQQRLNLIAERVSEILLADNCEIYLVKTEGILSLVAHNCHDRLCVSGEETKIAPDGELAGYIAFTRKPFRALGRDVLTHPELRHIGTSPHHSLLGLPLVKQDSKRETLVGLVQVSNKKGPDGTPHPDVGFSEPDLELLKLFAQAIVSAIASAELVSYEKALLECSLDGIIATDRFGKVTEFNAQAQEILGWTKEDVLGTSVQELYAAGEAQRIGRLLHDSRTGRIVNCEAQVTAKDGRHIPIRISANDLWDATGGWVGSVGHFEDLRSQQTAERRRQVLTDAITTVARADDLTIALRHFISRLVINPTYSFGHALLLRPDQETFDIIAGYPDSNEPPGALRWSSWVGRQTQMSKWPAFETVLRDAKPKLLMAKVNEHQPILQRLTRLFGLQVQMRSWLIVPMVMDGIVGYIGLGEIEGEHQTAFDHDNISLIETVSTQVSVLIGRMRLDALAKQRLKDIEDLNNAARAMAECSNLKQLEVTILNQANSLAGSDFASMVILQESHLGKLFKRDFEEIGYPPEIRQRFQRGSLRVRGCNAKVISEKYVECTISSSQSKLTRATKEALRNVGVVSFQGVLLEVDKRPIAILYISHKAHYAEPVTFPRPRRFIESFANTAAMALKAAMLTDQMQRAKATFDALAKISALGDVDKTMDAVAAATRDLLLCDIVSLFACSTEEFEVTRSKMVGNKKNHPFTRVTPSSPVYAILQRAEPYVAEDVPTDPLLRNGTFPATEGVKSCVAIPLQVAKLKVGALFANYRTPFRHTEEDLATLRHIADQAAIAIHNAQLFEKKESQRRALDDLARTLLSATTRKAALDGVCKVIADHLRVTATEAVLPDADGLLRAAAAWGWKHRPDIVLDQGRGSFSGWVMEEKRAIMVANLTHPQKFSLLDHLKEMKVKSMLGVPMFKAGQPEPIGAMLVFSVHERFFSRDDEELLDLLAKETAIALERFTVTERAERLRYAAREVANVMVLGDRELKETLDAVVKGIGLTAGCDAVTLYACDPQTGRVDSAPSMYGVMFPEAVTVPANVVAPDSLVYKALKSNHPEAIEDVKRDQDFAKKRFVQMEGIRSCLVVPLSVASKKVGVMFVNYRRPHRFEMEEIDDIKLFANQAAVAIRNTRLFNEREKMRGVVAGQMALAGLGMIDSTSRHRTQNFAATIRNEAEDLAEMLLPKTKKGLTARQYAIAQSLGTIQERAKEILAQRLATPRLEGKEAESISVFREVKEWADRRRTKELREGVLLGPDVAGATELRVRISPLWLSRLLEILVDNAMRAVEQQPVPSVIINVYRQGQLAVIALTDNGSGIPEALQGKLFREAVPKTRESRGSGVGLLIAQAIAQTYQGEVRVARTGASGTTMELSLPIDESPELSETGEVNEQV